MAAALLLALAALQSPPTSPESQALDRISLFDGETLAGWRGDERFWGVEDGAIVGRSTPDAPCERTTYLVFEDATFADFELSLEYSIDGGNSGVQFRSVVSEDGAVSGYQADLEDGPNWTGGIYEQDGRGVLVRRGQDVTCAGRSVAWESLVATVDLDALGGARAWHSYRIRAVGSTVELFIDGHRTARLDDRSPAARASGVVALQLHQGPPMEIRFRNVALRDLGSASSDPAPAPRWIWHPDGPERARTARFERTLSVALGLRRATLFATCDNGVEIAIDGEIRAAGDAWERPFEVDVTEHLTAGTHAIGAECWNAGGPAGFLARLTLEYEDGRVETIVSDASWTVPGVGPAVDLGAFGCAPWGMPTARSSGSPERTLPPEDLELPPGFAAERLYTVPRAFGSWVALTVDERGRIVAAAEAHHGLFRLTLDEGAAPRVERLNLDVQGAQGLYARGDDLYVMRNEWDGGPNGLWRARDVDGDHAYDSFELLQALDGGGEHGPHAILPTPGGDRLQVIAGNATALPAELARSRVAQRWSDDQVLPSLPDTFGHGNTMHLHGGWTATCNLDGGDWELVACGMRNAYDFAFDASGEAFAYDSDMEWDMGLPWYRAPRVLHLVPGAEFGWRRGSGKIPADAPDTFPGVCDTGPASPVGVLHGAGGRFHPPFADRLFIGDWTRGRVLSVALEPAGDTYRGVVAPFVAGRPFPVTDMEWLPDGSMVIAIGGRGGRSALYRVWSIVGPSAAPRAAAPAAANADGPRAVLEKRAALEARSDVDAWALRALEEGSSEALLAVARVGGKELQAALIDAILANPAALRDARLRAVSLSIARDGEPEPARAARLSERLAVGFPSGDASTDARTLELLVRLDSTAAPALGLFALGRTTSQEEAIDLALALSWAESGWTDARARLFLDFLHVDARGFRGGRSVEGYLDRIRAAALERAGRALDRPYAAPAATAPAARPIEATFFVQSWTHGDLAPLLASLPGSLDAEASARGERAFRRARCFACHRVGDEGAGTGPDLTDAGARFTAHDLLVSLLEPSRDVSDQYRDTEVWTHDGEVFVGRRVDAEEGWVAVQEANPIDAAAGSIVEIPEEEIAGLRASAQSRMPTGLLDVLTREEIGDLLAWVLADKR